MTLVPRVSEVLSVAVVDPAQLPAQGIRERYERTAKKLVAPCELQGMVLASANGRPDCTGRSSPRWPAC